MIHTYYGDNFLNFRRNIFNYFDQEINNGNINDSEKEIIELLKEVFNNENLEILFQIDEHDLKYHNWSSHIDALNDYDLGSANRLLYNFSESHNVQIIGQPINFIEAFYLTLYADIYEFSIICVLSASRIRASNILKRLQIHSSKLTKENFQVLNRLWFSIPNNVFTHHLKEELDIETISIARDISKNEKFIEKVFHKSNTLKDEIEKIQLSLEEQKAEYNFVGLSQGFKNLKEQKKKELKNQNIFYYLLMIAILAIIVLKTYWSIDYINKASFDITVFIVSTISIVLFLFIILYFFRISLLNIKSIKSQILQIDLRLTLCQFIHNYENDTSKLRDERMKDSFDKFESVIFAPIVATEDQMPATFDGLEQLANALSTFNKSPN